MIATIRQPHIRQAKEGGGARQSAFKISCILMRFHCSINDDLFFLQIEYSPLSEWETETLLTLVI